MLFPLYSVVFIGFLGYSLMITVFTPMILRPDSPIIAADTSTSRRTILLGILLCLYPLGQFVGSPVLGALSDRFGRRPVLVASLGSTIVWYLVITAALVIRSLPLLSVALILAGLGEANVVTAQSAIADLVPPAQRNRYFGYIYMSASLAYVVGPLGGGKLADPALVPWFSDALPFGIVTGLLLMTAAIILLHFRETRIPDSSSSISLTAAFESLLTVFSDRQVRRFYAVNFLIYIAIFGFFRSYPMYLVGEFHLGVSRLSEFVAWVGVPIVLSNLWLTGFLSTRTSVRALTLWTAALTGILMIATVLPDNRAMLWPGLFLTAAALAVCLPSCATLLSNATGHERQGQVLGNNQALQVGAEALSGLVAGLLAAIMIKLPMLVLGGISLLAAALVALVIP